MLTAALVVMLLTFVSAVRAQSAKSTTSAFDQILICGSQSFLRANSQNVVELAYRRDLYSAEFQSLYAGKLNGEAATMLEPNSGGANSTRITSGLDLRLSRKIFDFSTSGRSDAANLAVSSAQADLQAELLVYLLDLNQRWLALELLYIERDITEAQIKELEELNQFASRLMKSRVIDAGDALLVKENLFRFQLRIIELNTDIASAWSLLEIDVGSLKSQLRISDVVPIIVDEGKSKLDVKAVTASLRNLISASTTFPRRRSANILRESLELEMKAVERTWYPSLLAEAGMRRPFSEFGSASYPFEGFVGLSLNIAIPTRITETQESRLRALRTVVQERERRADVESISLLTTKIERLAYIQSQSDISRERIGNLSRLKDLQIIKFRAGRLSFMNLNDVMLSFLDSRRQLATNLARMVAIDRDVKIYRFVLKSKLDEISSLNCR